MACSACGGKSKANTEYEVTVRATGETFRYPDLATLRIEMNRRQITGYTFRLVPKR